MKVFVTVGSMLPFDRLLAAMADWAAAHPQDVVFAQAGAQGRVPAGLEAQAVLAPAAFRQRLAWADVVVSHAGMGIVIETLAAGRPLVVLPRDAALGEATSDHQRATVGWLREQPGVHVADAVEALPDAIDAAVRDVRPRWIDDDRPAADRAQLIDTLRAFIHGG